MYKLSAWEDEETLISTKTWSEGYPTTRDRKRQPMWTDNYDIRE